ADTTRRRYAADSGFAGITAELRSAYPRASGRTLSRTGLLRSPVRDLTHPPGAPEKQHLQEVEFRAERA
ncbi:hypothetical protein, partial [Streptomyces canus]|uniref:hypothetical protein n=1 Tax=Streptomyces canus TaxID=58343 RepID=UPI002F90C289